MSQRIPNIQGVSVATDPAGGDVKIVGIVGTALQERIIPDGPSGVNAKTPSSVVTVTPSVTVT